MNILLLGADGQVGTELRRALAPLGELVACNRQQANLEDLDGLRGLIRQHSPTVIVNAAAYTAVDQAESDGERAGLINGDAVALLAEEAQQLGAYLVHYSTDYVFDGSADGFYRESDPVHPLSVYGRTKLAGERAIQQSGCHHLVFRTSWVYSRRGTNFATTMLKLASERDSLQVVADQMGAPTSAELIADVTALCLYHLSRNPRLAESLTGLYHLVAAGETSWYDYARHVIGYARAAGMPLLAGPEQVTPVSTVAFPRPAPRPGNSRLATIKLKEAFGIRLPPWQDHLDRMLRELITQVDS